jgi:hypothetical protein
MRRTVAKKLYKKALKDFPNGSHKTRRADGSMYWQGFRRSYQDSKKGIKS